MDIGCALLSGYSCLAILGIIDILKVIHDKISGNCKCFELVVVFKLSFSLLYPKDRKTNKDLVMSLYLGLPSQ